MLLRSITAAALLAAGAAHAACTAPVVIVQPLDVQEQTATLAELRVASGVSGELGAVVVKSTVRVNGCTAEVGYLDARLYVASELHRNACAWQHVMTHEQEHVRIYQRALDTLGERIKARAAAGADLFEAAKTEVLAVQAAQAAHDSPEEYARNATACEGAIVSIARRASRS